MDVEASLAERLQKLKQWQVEQQERLLKQQRIQREILSHEQDRIYKALGLPAYNFNVIENTGDAFVMHEINAKETMSDKALMLQCGVKNLDDVLEIIDKRMPTNSDLSCTDYNKDQNDDSDCAPKIVDRSGNSTKDRTSGVFSRELSDSLIEGVEPLLNNVSNRCTLIDDVPLPSPKKDFQTLLEEKLKRESEITSNAQSDTKIKPKKPFLRKGQGLSRFKMSTNLRAPTAKRYNTPLSSNTRHIDVNDKSKKSTIHKHILSKTLNNVSVKKRQLKIDPLPEKKVSSKPITSNRITRNAASNQTTYPPEMNISDYDLKAERELEEVRIFELLEEKAEDSSFCSTSSTVLAFLQQSTPFKIRGGSNQIKESTIASKEQQGDKRTSSMIEQEPTIHQVAHVGNSKSSVQHQVEPRKRSHTNATTVDSYWDTVAVDNMQEKTPNHFVPTDQAYESEEAYAERPENHDTTVITVSSDSDEERDASIENDPDSITHDSEADTSHHVRFSEYNEYRTIDLIDRSDAASNPPLRGHLEPRNWDDCSSDTSESSSDMKRELPFASEEQIHNSSRNIVNSEQAISIPRRSSLHQDVTRRNEKDLYKSLIKTTRVPEEVDVLSYKDESPDEDTCYGDECTPIIGETGTSDEEHSASSSSSSSSSSSDTRELNAHERKEHALRSEPKKLTEKLAKVYSNLEEADLYSEKRTNQASGQRFETELLKSRLSELEKEIDIFRKESSALLLQRRRLQEEEAILRKRYAEKEKDFEENKRRVRNQLEEEKKRVAREKAAMENRIRDAHEKAKQSKMERQRVQGLREELERLRDELNVKESRWSATESRYKSELRVLRVEISKLKQEVASLQNIKRTNVRSLKKSTGRVITRAINQINKRIVAPSKDPLPPKIRQDLSNTSSDTSAHDDEEDDEGNKSIMRATTGGLGQVEDDLSASKARYKRVELESQPKDGQKLPGGNVAGKKRHLYEDLLKDATSDLVESQNPFYIKQGDHRPAIVPVRTSKGNDRSYSSSTNEDLGHAARGCTSNVEHYADRSHEANQDSDESDVRAETERRKDRVSSPEKNSNFAPHPTFQSRTSKDPVKNNVQIQLSDGRIEYWYPNGNVKKILPDREITKMIYYNGDVREIDKNRRVKYFYAATQTWHTTTPDGLEILEFPDGQVEKRMTDGTVEVLFPDGTVAQTCINGDKILTLPNGQREIHTKAHKRREYPDGTVKLVYADGTQETRYSNGRKRLKDKDGNLLMDSYDV